MAVRLSVLRNGHALLPRNILFMFLILISIRLSKPQGHGAAGRIRYIERNRIESTTFRPVAECLNQLRYRVSISI
jgi:hypothetical protein